MSKKDLVPIEQEIEMCHSYLTIVGIQQRALYKLEISGISGEEMIPPAIFHTLIENGITHGFSGQENTLFKRHQSNRVTVHICVLSCLS